MKTLTEQQEREIEKNITNAVLSLRPGMTKLGAAFTARDLRIAIFSILEGYNQLQEGETNE